MRCHFLPVNTGKNPKRGDTACKYKLVSPSPPEGHFNNYVSKSQMHALSSLAWGFYSSDFLAQL